MTFTCLVLINRRTTENLQAMDDLGWFLDGKQRKRSESEAVLDAVLTRLTVSPALGLMLGAGVRPICLHPGDVASSSRGQDKIQLPTLTNMDHKSELSI